MCYHMCYQGVETELECGDVVLFWRIQQMLKVQLIPILISIFGFFVALLEHRCMSRANLVSLY